MTTFDKREEGFEAKFAHDEEMRFRVMARRDRLFGLWAAERLGMSGEAAQGYALGIVRADLRHAGDEDVLERVTTDLKASGQDVPNATLRAELQRCFAKAMRDLELNTR